MKLTAIELMEGGMTERKEVERKLYREFKLEVEDSTIGDWWCSREKLKMQASQGGDKKAALHPRWPELDDKLLPVLTPLEERGVLTLEIIRTQVSGDVRRD